VPELSSDQEERGGGRHEAVRVDASHEGLDGLFTGHVCPAVKGSSWEGQLSHKHTHKHTNTHTHTNTNTHTQTHTHSIHTHSIHTHTHTPILKEKELRRHIDQYLLEGNQA